MLDFWARKCYDGTMNLKKIVAEFYTADEWEDQKMQASRSLEDVVGNELEESKVKAAKELVEKENHSYESVVYLLDAINVLDEDKITIGII